MALGAATLDDCALTVLATVVSQPAADRIILDCRQQDADERSARGIAHGARATARCCTRRTGAAIDDGALTIERLSEEHATVRVTGAHPRSKPGDRVRVVPNHSCVVSNLVDEVRLVEGDRVIDTHSGRGAG